jgi:hypothetical protein
MLWMHSLDPQGHEIYSGLRVNLIPQCWGSNEYIHKVHFLEVTCLDGRRYTGPWDDQKQRLAELLTLFPYVII